MAELLAAGIVLALTGLSRFLPLAACRRIGAAMGWLGSRVVWNRNRIARNNWRAVFGQPLSRGQLTRLWSRLGANLASAMRLPAMPWDAIRPLVHLEGSDNLKTAHARGRGVVLVAGHFSCWELLAHLPAAFPGIRFHTLYQPLLNSKLDAQVRAWRSSHGVGLVNRRGAWENCCRRLRQGDVVAVFIDQHAGDAGLWTPLFGRLASTTPLPALLARRTGAAIVPVAIRTRPDRTWEATFHPALDFPKPQAGPLAAALNRWIESTVRSSPEDWFWFHERWKIPNPRFLAAADPRAVFVPEGAGLKPFRILVRGVNWLGDAVMTLATLQALKKGRPDACLTVLTPPKLAALYRACPFIDEILEAPANRSLIATARLLRRHAFDIGLVLPNSWRSVLELMLGGVKHRAGFRIRARTALAINWKAPARARAGIRHQTAVWTGALANFGARPPFESPALERIPPAPGEPRLGIIAPGAEYGPAKRWPAARFAAAARELSGAVDRWIVVGAAGDMPAAEAVLKELPAAENRCGATTLADLIDLLRRAALVLCNDSGVMHLAAFAGAPAAAVFGSTEPALTGPCGGRVAVVRRHIPCSPCFLRECPLGHLACLHGVTPDAVAAAARAALQPGATTASLALPGLARYRRAP